MTLKDAVALETAQLLIDAAEARRAATKLGDKERAAKLLGYAATLEQNAGKWEQRLRWWDLLRQR